MLVPVCELHAGDERADRRRCSRWREDNAFAFPTRFPVTEAGTAHVAARRACWTSPGPDAVPGQRPLRPRRSVTSASPTPGDGDRALEVDNVVRGEQGGQPGLMGAAIDGAAAPGREELLRPGRIELRVFDDNDHAIAFYRRLGLPPTAVWIAAAARGRDGEGGTARAPATTATRADRRFLGMDWAPGRRRARRADPDRRAVDLRARGQLRHRRGPHGWNDAVSRLPRPGSSASSPTTSAPSTRCATSSCTGALHLALLARSASARATR